MNLSRGNVPTVPSFPSNIYTSGHYGACSEIAAARLVLELNFIKESGKSGCNPALALWPLLVDALHTIARVVHVRACRVNETFMQRVFANCLQREVV